MWDSESDDFVEGATKLHFLQLGALDTDEATVYSNALPGYKSLEEGLERLSKAEKLIGHNSIRHDYPLVEKLYPGTLRRSQVIDTLVMCRLKDPENRENSLSALGRRLGVLKGEFVGPWDTATPEMAEYAAQDVVVGRAVYNANKEVMDWGDSFQIETDTAWAIAAQEVNGFRLDVKKAEALEVVLRSELLEEQDRLRDVFPPRWVQDGKEPFVPARDNKSQGYVQGCPVTKAKLEVFNPGSRAQVASRLIKLGWKPKDFTPTGQAQVDETILAALPYPEAQRMVAFFGLKKKLGQLSDGDNGWLKLVKPDGRVYGAVNTNGACTGRMSHFAPNMAQVDTDHRMRELWIPREGWKLVGCDAEGLEARMLAHYLARYDGGSFGDKLLNGKKENGTDVHSSNRDAVVAAGFKVNRDGAKTLLYAMMYGAGDKKLGQTIIDNLREQGLAVPKLNLVVIGKRVRAALATSMVGIDKLVDTIKETVTKQGFLRALDGRHLMVRSEHAALNTLLQGGGAIVMKKALCLFMDMDTVIGNEGYYGLCANVHDEVQIEADPELAPGLGQTFADCIRDAGAHFNLRCPLAGAYDVGNNWSETH